MHRSYHHPKSWLILASVMLMSGMAWLLLFFPGSGGVIELCGNDGLFAYVVPWDGGRLIGLVVMWGAMMAAMLGPCIARNLVATGWDVRQSYGPLTGALCHGLGYFACIVPLIGLAAGLEWTLESLGIVTAGAPPEELLAQAPLFVLGLVLVIRPRKIGATFSNPVAGGVAQARGQSLQVLGMISLQLAGGSMNLTWMLALAGLMWIAEFLPRRTWDTRGAARFYRASDNRC